MTCSRTPLEIIKAAAVSIFSPIETSFTPMDLISKTRKRKSRLARVATKDRSKIKAARKQSSKRKGL